MVTGRIHSKESFGTLDGPGVRFVLFLQGCPLRCQYCHNPDTWQVSGGTEVTSEAIVADILQYRNFIESGGVTLSGGEPLMQLDFTRDVLERCAGEKLHTAIDTAGSIPLAKCRSTVDIANLILLDIKALSPELCTTLTGQDNRNALDLLNYCQEVEKDVWIRHVLVPGLTLEAQRLEELAQFLTKYSVVKRIDLLPFHQMGRYKWADLGYEYKLESQLPPTAPELDLAREIFRKHGHKV